MSSTLFVTGTDTDVGKTIVSAGLCCALNGNYWKPIQAGLCSTDTKTVAQWIGRERVLSESYRLTEPISPHLAARKQGVHINLSAIKLPLHNRPLIIEGAGGVLVPVSERHYVVDLAAMLEIPTIIVVQNVLGAINHTLLTIEALRSRSVEIIGIVLNGTAGIGNAEAIKEFGSVEVLLEIPSYDKITPTTIETIGSLLKSNSAIQRFLEGERICS